MARSLPRFLALCALLLLVALLYLGFWSRHRASEVRAELASQVAIAQNLQTLQKSLAASETSAPALSEALDTVLGELAPAARDLAEEQEAGDVPEQLADSLDSLLYEGLAATDAADRGRALSGFIALWQAAQQDHLAQGAYPQPLEQKLEGLAGFTCQQKADRGSTAAPAALNLQGELAQLGYVSEVIAARQEYSAVQAQAQGTAGLAASSRAELEPLLSCWGLSVAPEPFYPVPAPDGAEQELTNLLGQVGSSAQLALAEPELPVTADELELLLVKVALDASSAQATL
ncbi:MAG: hypothetical protein Q3965_00940 [Rothia sp. (in: high G+C Gram-positive bacteria)]|nr:hypothetical protein [Rothia sp. (in: high G+C Gram-positive bacteria)]